MKPIVANAWAIANPAGADRTLAVTCTVAAALAAAALRGVWIAHGQNGSPAASWLLVLGFTLAVLTIHFARGAIGAVWRLSGATPRVSVSSEGLSFHPSLRSGRVPWSDISAVRVLESGTRTRTPVLILDFRRFFVSPLAWIPRRRLQVWFPGQGAEAQRLLRAIRAEID